MLTQQRGPSWSFSASLNTASPWSVNGEGGDAPGIYEPFYNVLNRTSQTALTQFLTSNLTDMMLHTCANKPSVPCLHISIHILLSCSIKNNYKVFLNATKLWRTLMLIYTICVYLVSPLKGQAMNFLQPDISNKEWETYFGTNNRVCCNFEGGMDVKHTSSISNYVTWLSYQSLKCKLWNLSKRIAQQTFQTDIWLWSDGGSQMAQVFPKRLGTKRWEFAISLRWRKPVFESQWWNKSSGRVHVILDRESYCFSVEIIKMT